MKFTAEVLTRAWEPINTAGVDLTPLTWDAQAIGGPTTATIAGSGDLHALWATPQWLGYHVRIRNADGTPVWWGIITGVQVTTEGASVAVTLDDMRNRINVDYSYTDNDGAPQDGETGWAEYAQSVAQYGPWEERVPLADATLETAQTRRDTWLKKTQAPAPSIDWSGGDPGLRIDCRGYWSLLGNVYYADASGRIVYDEPNTIEHMLGWELAATWSIGFHEKVGGKRIHDLNARLYDVTVGTMLDVTGTTLNNRSFTVSGVPSKPDSDYVEYTTDDCFFAANDEIFDNHAGFEVFTPGEMLAVLGTADDEGHEDNNGYWFIQGLDNASNMEVSGIGRNILNSATGQTVTFVQGHSVTVDEFPNRENPSASTFTLTSHGVRVAQSFQITGATAWTAHEVLVRVRKIGAPASPLLVRIYSDSAGTPTTMLAEGTIAAADIQTVTEWATVTLGTPYTLQPATTYWVAVSSGSTGLACYAVGLTDDEDAQYAGGTCKIQIAAGSWETRWGQTVSMPFQVWGNADTGTQVQAMAAYALPGFTCIVRTPSGTLQRAYRDGMQRALSEARDMIETGDTDGNRIAVTVTHDRLVIVGIEEAVEDSDPAACLHYDALTGELRRADGGPAPAGIVPAGQIVYLDNTETVGALLAQTRRVYVESASYDAENGRLRMEPRGRRAPWEL